MEITPFAKTLLVANKMQRFGELRAACPAYLRLGEGLKSIEVLGTAADQRESAATVREFVATHVRVASTWAIGLMTVAGGVAGYLWWNAEPSKVLMGDAGSRFLGLLVGVGVLASGNPLLVFALAPVVLVNGGGGLAKLVLLRLAKKLHMDVGEENVLRRVRFPLHDHCKKNLKWSNAQVLMRFVMLQVFLMPLLLLLFIKVR